MSRKRVRQRANAAHPPQMRRIRLRLDDIAHLGEAVGRSEGLVVFASYGIPGEEVEVELAEEKTSFARGRVVNVLEPAQSRVEPPCPYFGECGGCQWQHIDYGTQLELKRSMLAHVLRRIGRFEDPAVPPVLPSQEWEYRNQARFSAKPSGLLGFNRYHTHRLLPVDDCRLMHPAINDTLRQLQGRWKGVKHQVIVRHGLRTGRLLIYPKAPFPDVQSGQDGLEEEVLGRRFWVPTQAFFQVNTRQTDTLTRLVLEMLEPLEHHTVVDAYCGVGTFALLLSARAGRVIGIEESKSAIKAAKRNLQPGEPAEFIAGKVEEVLPRLPEGVDGVILDPPRAGCHPAVLEAVLRMRPRRVVYVSCEPSTLARDLRTLCDGGYGIARLQPVDMFPQTYHLETAVLLAPEGGKT